MRSGSKTSGTPASAATGGKSPRDEELVQQAVEGDEAAFEELVLRYQDRVYSLLCRQCGSLSEAEDLTQETFLKAYRALASFRHGSKFYTWLFRIAVNAGYSRGRKVARIKRREGVSLDATVGGEQSEEGGSLIQQVAGDERADPATQAEQSSVQERIQEGLAELKEEYRAVVLLRDMEGLDYEAIAEALNITRAAVKSRLHRARMELARLLKDLRPEGMEVE